MSFLKTKGAQWEWTKECKLNETCKHGLTVDALLVRHDQNRELRLACDAYSYTGLLQSSTMDDGQERSMAYASQTPS